MLLCTHLNTANDAATLYVGEASSHSNVFGLLVSLPLLSFASPLTAVVTFSDEKKPVSSSEADVTTFEVGAEVQVFALQSAAGQKLNGLPGVVTADPGANGRYTIQIVVCVVTLSVGTGL